MRIDTYYRNPGIDHPLFKTIGTVTCRVPASQQFIQPLVYLCVFVNLAETAIEGFNTSNTLVSSWGDTLFGVDWSAAFNVTSDLQPLCDGLRGSLPANNEGMFTN